MLFLLPFLIFIIITINVLTSSIYSKLELNEDKKYNLNEAEDIFIEFIKKHEKKYKSENEYNYRLQVFKKNLNQINEWNEDSTSLVDFKVNLFTDMSFDEFSEKYSRCAGNYTPNPEETVEYVPTGTAPESLDWRQSGKVTEVKNQNPCGACFVFSAVGCIEGQYAIKHGILISLSEQQGLDCESQGSCDGGYPINVMNALAQQGGSMRNQDYPYIGHKGQCHTDRSKIAVQVTGGVTLQIADEEGLKSAVAQYGPIATVIEASPMVKGYTGGVFRPTDCLEPSNHAVLVVGYGTENGVPYWIIKNSWGTVYGEQGYIRLVRGERLCRFGTVNYMASVA